MLILPPPTGFEQGQRKLFGLAMMASGLFCGAVSLGLTILFAYLAFRFPEHRETSLYVLAGNLAATILLMGVVMISMAVGGPVGRFKVQASKEGMNLEASGDGEPVVTTTTTTSISPPETPGEPLP